MEEIKTTYKGNEVLREMKEVEDKEGLREKSAIILAKENDDPLYSKLEMHNKERMRLEERIIEKYKDHPVNEKRVNMIDSE
jgi:hypothetical protein